MNSLCRYCPYFCHMHFHCKLTTCIKSFAYIPELMAKEVIPIIVMIKPNEEIEESGIKDCKSGIKSESLDC